MTMIQQRNEKLLNAEGCHLPGSLEAGSGNHQSVKLEQNSPNLGKVDMT